MWDDPSQTLTLTGTINQINANIGCATFSCPQIWIDAPGTVTVNIELDDDTYSQTVVSTGTYNINAS